MMIKSRFSIQTEVALDVIEYVRLFLISAYFLVRDIQGWFML